MKAARQVGHRRPRLAGLDTALSSGLWAAAVDRMSVVTAPGASPTCDKKVSRTCDKEVPRPGGTVARGPRVMKNAATLRQISERQFGA